MSRSSWECSGRRWIPRNKWRCRLKDKWRWERCFSRHPRSPGFPLCPRQRRRRPRRPPAPGSTARCSLTGAADSAAGGLVPESLDGFNVRVPTGPFASRSAGPLGPILATSEADLTPPVDRHERGLFQEIEGLNDDDAANVTERRSQLASVDASAVLGHDQRSSEADPTEGPVVALTRGGGFPLKVTGLASGQRADLPALLASLPATSDSERQNASLAGNRCIRWPKPGSPSPRNRLRRPAVRSFPTTSRRPAVWPSGWD